MADIFEHFSAVSEMFVNIKYKFCHL